MTKRVSTAFLLLAMVVGVTILVSLGTWQVKRLHWKEGLIARVNERLTAATVSPLTLSSSGDSQSLEYSPVSISGTFPALNPSYELTTHKGQSGWNVFIPFRLEGEFVVDGADMVMVNLGFIPFAAKDDDLFLKTAKELADTDSFGANINLEPQEVVGLYRTPLLEKPGRFVSDNDPDKKTYYWRDINAMALSTAPGAKFQDWYLDLGLPSETYPETFFPIPGTTRVTFTNNHMQYAVTWYGLALALLGVGSYFLYQANKKKRTG